MTLKFLFPSHDGSLIYINEARNFTNRNVGIHGGKIYVKKSTRHLRTSWECEFIRLGKAHHEVRGAHHHFKTRVA